jgi:hypothetical protein
MMSMGFRIMVTSGEVGKGKQGCDGGRVTWLDVGYY